MLVTNKALGGRVMIPISALIFAGTILGSQPPADAATYSDRLCAAMPEMLAFASAFKGNAPRLQELSENGTVLSVTKSSAGFKVTSDSAAWDVSSGAIAAASCAIFPTGQTLEDTGSISASYVLAFAKVQSYRRNHSWPIPGANATPYNVDVVMARSNEYVTVSVGDNVAHRDASGRILFTCEGIEYYRVTISTGLVLPYDGCVEGHSRVLPRLSQLPA
jgi:hypothetical protein